MIFESHIHLDDPRYDKDREELIESLAENNIAYVLNPGADRASSERAFELSQKYERVYGAVGTHPHDAKDFTGDDLSRYEELAGYEKIVAIGEIGLDFHYDNSPRDIQEEVFRIQMDLAERLGLPVLIHSREAIDLTHEVLYDYRSRVRGVIHCYSDNWENAKRFLDLGYYIALGGVVTFNKAEDTREVARKIPLDRLLLETDGPYLAPMPFRGKRNEPKYINLVAEKIAEVRGEDLDKVIHTTYANTMEMLGL